MKTVRNFHSMRFDVAIVAGPRLPEFPTVGVRELSTLLSKFGLETGWVGGEGLFAKGVLPAGGSGGLALVEDAQGRAHRIQARAVVRFVLPDETPSPFEGSSHPSVLLGTTATKLVGDRAFIWNEPIVILGTGNRALRFGRGLLERGCPEVTLTESYAQWEGKRYAGWEVERRRFETLGGKLIEGNPLSFRKLGTNVGEFRLQDAKGIRVLEAAKLISFGPFSPEEGLKEYPPGSLLFEIEQTAPSVRATDPEGWMLEEERARILAARIAKALVPELGNSRDEIEAILRRSRSRMKRMDRYLDEPFELAFTGKWTAGAVLKNIKQFSGVPKTLHHTKPIASVECFETIGCDLCERACPTDAIRLDRLRSRKAEEEPRSILDESACIACGLCVQVCPSATPVMLEEPVDRSMGRITFSWRETGDVPEAHTFVTLVNRRGDALGTGRVIGHRAPISPPETPTGLVFYAEFLVEVEVPSHLVWEARGIRRLKAHASAVDADFIRQSARDFFPDRVEISWNGGRRFVRNGIPISTAFFENGFQRMNDRLLCEDGSCSLCEVEVDGVRQLACRTMVRKGMAIQSVRDETPSDDLCPCLGIQESDFLARVEQGNLLSVDAAFESTGLGSGRCHGQLCIGPAKRCLEKAGLDPKEVRNHLDWRFPWSDWKIDPGKLQ
jgi:ferredoxin